MDLTIPCFDPALIARSGQCFRMREGKGGIVTALAGADRVRMTPLGGDRFRFDCPPEDFERRWRAYFDLDTDYEAIQREAAGQDELLAHAACTCRGLRILRQNPWETLVCFLISQRKSIPAIQTCVEALCTRCGAKVGRGRGRYFAFPGPEDLLRAGERGLRALPGTGVSLRPICWTRRAVWRTGPGPIWTPWPPCPTMSCWSNLRPPTGRRREGGQLRNALRLSPPRLRCRWTCGFAA